MRRSHPILVAALAALASLPADARAEAPACPASVAEFSGKGIKAQISAESRGGVLAALRSINEVFKACAALRQKIADGLIAIARNGATNEEEAAVYTLGNLQLSWRSTEFEDDKRFLYAAYRSYRAAKDSRLAAVYDKALMNAAGLYRDAARDFEKRFDPALLPAAEAGLSAVIERYPDSTFADDAAYLLASFQLRAALRALQGDDAAAARARLAAAVRHYEALAGDYEAFLEDPAAKTRFAQPAPMALPALYHLALAQALSGEDEKAAAGLKRIEAIYERSLGESRRIVYAYSIYFFRVLWLDQPPGAPPPLNERADLKFLAGRTAAILPAWRGKLGAYAGVQQFARALEDEARQSADFGISLGRFDSHAEAKAQLARVAPTLAALRRDRPALAAAIFQPSGESQSFAVVLRPLAPRDKALRLFEELKGALPAGAEVMRIP